MFKKFEGERQEKKHEWVNSIDIQNIQRTDPDSH